MSETERRAYPRQETSLAADLHVFGYGTWPCEIRDYCPGGLFLAHSLGPEEELLFEESVYPGTPVEIRLDDANGRLNMSADVVRINENGIGVQFPVPNPALAERLRPADAKHERHNLSRLSRDGESVLLRLRNQSCRFMDERFEEFLLSVQDELIAAAGEADNNQEQGQYFEAMSGLRDAAKSLPMTVADQIQIGLTTFEPLPSYKMERRNPDNLELVDDRDFEHWLAVSELSTTASNRLRRPLDALNLRLSQLAGKEVDLSCNPLVPENLCRIVSGHLRNLDVSGKALAIVYRTLGSCLIFELGSLYDALNAQLISEGILPELAEPGQLSSRAAQHIAAETTAPLTASENTPSVENYPVGSIRHLDGLAQLFGLRNQVASSRASNHNRTRGSDIGQDQTERLQQVVEALSRVPVGDAARGRPLRDRVVDSMGQGESPADALNGQAEAAIGLTSELIAAVDDDELVHGRSRKWFRKLESMIARLLIQDSGFIQEIDHPLRQAMDELGQVYFESGLADSRRQKRVVATVDKLIDNISQMDPKEEEALKSSAAELNRVLARMNKTRQRLEQRAVEAAQGKDLLEHSRNEVTAAIGGVFGDEDLPEPVKLLLDEGWSKLLVLSNLRNGADSQAWQQQMGAVNTVKEFSNALQAPPDSDALDDLTSSIEEQLGQDSTSKAFLEAVERHLSSAPRSQWERIIPAGFVESQADQPAQLPVDSDKLGRIKLLQIGEWISVPDSQGEERPMRLIWKSDDEKSLVFVNRTGRKVINFKTAELASAMSRNRARILDNFDMPLLDRSWQSLLQKMHGELATEAIHDALTGLLNRQAFERLLGDTLTAPDSAERTHGLFYIGLDGFKLVNTTMGLDQGDTLLTRVSERLKSHMNERSHAGRVGGDEFCILMTDCSSDRAERYAEGIRELISDHDFELGEETYGLNASVGAALLDANVETAQAALRLADQACDAAKAAGGNRVFTWQSDSQALRARERGMIWARRIDDALKNRELQLVAQRIAPTDSPWGHGAFYEVLVRMKAGKEGVLTSPAEFIPAAERFGRIATLDRWIITEALTAMADYWRSDLAGLTINVSGQSLSQTQFMDFLVGILKEHAGMSHRICFEITETATINNLSEAADFIFKIKEQGCQISLDDFGSGMSSYGYLKNLPVDFVKIDGQFVREIEHSMPDFAVVRSINELGHFLGKRTIAEHVEKISTLDKIKEIGVDFVQGYGIEAPKPLSEILCPQLEKAQ